MSGDIRLVAPESSSETRVASQLLDAVGEAVVATDLAGRVIYWNNAAEQLSGTRFSAAIGRPLVESMMPAENQLDIIEMLSVVVAGGRWSREMRLVRADGEIVTALVTCTPIRDADAIRGMVAVYADITARRDAETALDATERQLHAIVDTAQEGIVVDDPNGIITFANPQFADMLGIPFDEIVGMSIHELVDPDHRAELDTHYETRRGGASETYEIPLLHRDGHRVWVSVSAAPLYDSERNVDGAVALIADVTEHKRATDELIRLALQDPLTNLPNRHLALDRLNLALLRQAREKQSVAVLFVDLNEFGLINESLGHVAGDEVLKQVSARLAEAVRPGDTVARFGGDEFVVICDEVPNPDAATDLALRLLEAFGPPVRVTVGGTEEQVTVSARIGVAVAHSGDPNDVIRNAEAAARRAKRRVGGAIEMHDEMQRAVSVERLRLVSELRHAVEHREFRLRYQPVISIETGRTVGLEALIRWEHPTRGTVPPAAFIDVAERTGLIVDIGEWVLQEASQQSAAMSRVKTTVDIAVNLSARQLMSRDLVGQVAHALSQSGANPSSLILEVTESALMEDAETALEVLTALRQLGVRLAIDDFGTGYSSLVYLKKFPVDMLKIDGAFVNGLGRNADDSAIVTSIIGLARAVGVQVVAEGVETPEQLKALRALGCDFAQGYLWSGAVGPSELRALLRRIDEQAAAPALASYEPPVPPTAATQSTETMSVSREHKLRRHGIEDDCLTRVAALRTLGASAHSIASALNLEGWRTRDGRRWHASTVRALLLELDSR